MKSAIFTGFLVLLVIVDVIHASSGPMTYYECLDMCCDRYELCASTCEGKKLVKNVCEASFQACLRVCFQLLDHE
ncbi:hypothetical protein LSAT2_021734 [Lamellibrachia satsuma]|nr:hypothetical protein LSAT2_021734 [Lamellibrachia satsuma]